MSGKFLPKHLLLAHVVDAWQIMLIYDTHREYAMRLFLIIVGAVVAAWLLIAVVFPRLGVT